MDKFVLNLIHRPEMVPEYSATVTGQGKEEDIGDKALLTESLDIFLLYGCGSDQLHQGNLSDRKMCGCNLLGGRPESISYLQQLLVYLI